MKSKNLETVTINAHKPRNWTSNVEFSEMEKESRPKRLKVINEDQEGSSLRKEDTGESGRQTETNHEDPPKVDSGIGASNDLTTPYSLISDKSYQQLYKVINDSEKKRRQRRDQPRRTFEFKASETLEISENFKYCFSREATSEQEEKVDESVLGSSLVESRKADNQEKTMNYIIEARKQREIIRK